MRTSNLPEIGFKLIKLHDAFCAPLAKKYGLNLSTLTVIIFIADHPDMNTARDMCKKHGMKSAIVSVSIENAIKKGFLIRENDKNDRRIQRLKTTEKAQPMINEFYCLHEEFEHLVLSRLTEDEIETYLNLSQKLLDTINSLDPGVKPQC